MEESPVERAWLAWHHSIYVQGGGDCPDEPAGPGAGGLGHLGNEQQGYGILGQGLSYQTQECLSIW